MTVCNCDSSYAIHQIDNATRSGVRLAIALHWSSACSASCHNNKPYMNAELIIMVTSLGENWNNFFDDLKRFDTEVNDLLIEKD